MIISTEKEGDQATIVPPPKLTASVPVKWSKPKLTSDVKALFTVSLVSERKMMSGE